MAKAYPSSSVTVFDLPQVVETAQKHFSQENDAVVFETGEPHSASVTVSTADYGKVEEEVNEPCCILLKISLIFKNKHVRYN